jgi:hypothetical protein
MYRLPSYRRVPRNLAQLGCLDGSDGYLTSIFQPIIDITGSVPCNDPEPRGH